MGQSLGNHEDAGGAARRSGADLPGRLHGRVVLVVDDDPTIVMLVRMALEDEGAAVFEAADGEAGLAAFVANRPDIVITDILMPVKEGIETIVEMKRRSPDVKIVAVSGGGRLGAENFLSLAQRLGADEALAKPFRLQALIDRCAALLN